MEKELPKRKPTRLKNFDYSSPGAYFITICTKERHNYFWKDVGTTSPINVGATIGRPLNDEITQKIELSQHGKVVEEAILNISTTYAALELEYYVIMPDHIHLLLRICTDENGRPMVAPTMSCVVQQLKGYVSKRIGTPIWQKSFFDHIIRNRKDFEEHIKYIYENPLRWCYEKLYIDE